MVPSKRCLELSLSGSIIRAIGARRVKLNRPIGYGGEGGGGGGLQPLVALLPWICYC